MSRLLAEGAAFDGLALACHVALSDAEGGRS
jgi:hypothetical protein